jgi:glycosyltransferase involved in cell wall biosynthesis
MMKKKILIATPCFGNMITNGYFLSILATMQHFANDPFVEICILTIGDQSLVTKARNMCVTSFMQGDYTHLLFIDADIQFNPENIRRLIDKNDDVVCGAYPVKRIEWEALRSIDPSVLKTLSDSEIQARLLKYNLHVTTQTGEYSKRIDNGFMDVSRAATGFMLIRRTVFTKLMKLHPELKYINIEEPEAVQKYLWSFFNCGINKYQAYVGEDYNFCDMWTNVGGKIWIDILSPLSHIGTHTYNGNIVQTMSFR